MKPISEFINKVHLGNCLDLMKEMPAESVDCIVTDPPAGISFMGKKWDDDKGGRDQWIKWLSDVMREGLRVLKPGGHALVWSLPRTSHWTGMALENAGFEVRDIVHHVFGTGFPKSMDISKAIDKQFGVEREVIGQRQDILTKQAKDLREGKRKIVESLNNGAPERNNGFVTVSADITAPTTPEAKQWSGWGTALKPATEIWLLCRKPLIVVPIYNIVEQNTLIKGLLCQISPVKYVELFSTLNPNVSKEVLSDFAQWIADASLLVKNEDLSEKTGMFKSQEMEKTFLNIVKLWSIIWVENLNQENKYTTSITSETTIELRTLKSLILQTTQAITQDQSIQTDGTKQSVKLAVVLLDAVVVKLRNILMLIAPELVGKMELCLVNSEKRILGENEIGTVDLKQYPKIEHWILCRKPLSEKTVAENVLKWGTGGINIDGCRVPYESVKDYETLVDNYKGGLERATPETKENWTLHGGGWKLGKGIEIPDENKGRFPANLIHDGSDEVMAEFEKYGIKTSGKVKNEKEAYDGCSITGFIRGKSTFTNQHGDTGTPSRFFYCAKPSKSERDGGLENAKEKKGGSLDGGADTRNGKIKTNQPMRKNHHPTVKAQALMEYLIKLITPLNGIVLDMFAGSGSTLIAAKKLGHPYIGIEIDPEYCEIAELRVGYKETVTTNNIIIMSTNTRIKSQLPNIMEV